MVSIRHDWDTSNPDLELEKAFVEYRIACYGVCDLCESQIVELRQAFLSGIHWLNCCESYDPDEVMAALIRLLKQ